MTLELRCKLDIKTGFTNEVSLTTPNGERIDATIDDILDAAYYVLTNTNLGVDDSRQNFIKVMKQMKVILGYGGTARRLVYKNYLSLCPPDWKKE